MMHARLTRRLGLLGGVALTGLFPARALSQTAPRLDPPVIAGIVAEIGLVRLTWDDAPTTNVSVSGYHVYRRVTGKGSFERLTRTPVVDKVFTDEGIRPRQDLEYAVASVCGDPAVADAVRAGPDGEGPKSTARAIRSRDLVEVTLRLVSRFPSDIAGAEPLLMARVTIRKLEDGVWVEKDYTVRKGDRIGRQETILLGGRPVDVDFETGFTVLSIDTVKVERPGKAVRTVIDPKTARKIGEEEVVVTREVPTWKMVYRDAAGGTVEIVLEDPSRGSDSGSAQGKKKVR